MYLTCRCALRALSVECALCALKACMMEWLGNPVAAGQSMTIVPGYGEHNRSILTKAKPEASTGQGFRARK